MGERYVVFILSICIWIRKVGVDVLFFWVFDIYCQFIYFGLEFFFLDGIYL